MYDVKLLRDDTNDGIRVIYVETCKEVCSQQIAFAVKDGVILDAGFLGGCSGNTQGIAALVKENYRTRLVLLENYFYICQK